jgi:hypothetical protein
MWATPKTNSSSPTILIFRYLFLSNFFFKLFFVFPKKKIINQVMQTLSKYYIIIVPPYGPSLTIFDSSSSLATLVFLPAF